MSNAAGLAGVVAGETAICTVGHEGVGLNYRGYAITDLAEHATFEEVAYLLLEGELPSAQKLQSFCDALIEQRRLPAALKETLEKIPAQAHPMDVLRTGCSFLGNLEPEEDFSQQTEKAIRLLASFPAMICYWYHFSHHKKRIETALKTPSTAGYFLEMLHGEPADALMQKTVDVSLTLYAEHEFNASTFAARVTSATLSDFYSAITSAIGTLRGPLHGGANEAAMALIEQFDSVDAAIDGINTMLANKTLIMGFGHRVYKTNDPRSDIIKAYSRQLAEKNNGQVLHQVSQAIEKAMWDEKKLFPNADFYSASSYHFCNIPTPLFTPIFVFSRVSGWAAHVFEQRANNKLIRPNAIYTGPKAKAFIPMDKRS